MTKMRITLNRDDFRTLVSGGEVTFDQSDLVLSNGITFEPASDDGVKIILEDIGWPNMAAIIEEAWHVWPIEPIEGKP